MGWNGPTVSLSSLVRVLFLDNGSTLKMRSIPLELYIYTDLSLSKGITAHVLPFQLLHEHMVLKAGIPSSWNQMKSWSI